MEANVLADRAEAKSGAEADRLFAQASEKYQAALTIKPDLHDALYYWGLALMKQATMKSGAEADRLFIAAGDKFQAALALKPDFGDALGGWGFTLIQRGANKTGDEQSQLLNLAVEKLSEGFKRGWKWALYNLACAAALQGDHTVAKRHLRAAMKRKALPDKAHIANDRDFAALRDERWFQEFIQNLEGKDEPSAERLPDRA